MALFSEMMDEAGDLRNEIERLRAENGRLRAIVRVNLMRSCGATHEEIDAILDPVGTGSKT